MSSNSTADGRFTIAVTFDIGVESRSGAGAGAEPRRHRAAAPAAGGAQYRRDREQELARPDDGRASDLAGPLTRYALRIELRQSRDQGRADARRRRRLDHGVRQPRLRHARLARSAAAADARANRERRGRRAAAAERAGRIRRAQPAAGEPSRARSRSRSRRRDGSPTRRSSATSSSRRRTTRRCCSRTWRRIELAAQDYGTNSYLSARTRRSRSPIFQRPGSNALATARRHPHGDGANSASGFRPGSNTRSSTIRRSSSRNR